MRARKATQELTATGRHGAAAIPASPSMPSYAEDRTALRWPMLGAGVYGPAFAIVFFIAALSANVAALIWASYVIWFLAVGWWVFGSGMWMRYLWATGFRLDGSGVRVGGVGWAERHPGRDRKRTALVPWQCSQVFSCPWSGVLSIGVTTDPDTIKIMKRHACRGRKLTPLGNLAVPYMRAALVIWVDESQADVPSLSPATSMWWSNCSEDGYHQPLWIVPTRRPAQLQAALAQAPLTAARLQDPRELFSLDPPIAEWASR